MKKLLPLLLLLYPLLTAITTKAGGAPPSSFAWSPDGSQIAFAASGYAQDGADLFVINADGTGYRNLTNREYGLIFDETWSPDNKTLAFVANGGDSETTPIYLLELHSGEVRTLSADQNISGGLHWSPDGTQLAATTFGDLIIFEVASGGYIKMNADGRARFVQWMDDNGFIYVHGVESVLHTYLCVAVDSCQRLPSDENITAFPYLAWSPDGAQIAFSGKATEADPLNVYIADPLGNIQQHLTSAQTEYLINWLPDGKHIISLITPADESSQSLWITPLDFPEGASQIYCGKWGLETVRLSPARDFLAFEAAGGQILIASVTGETFYEVTAHGDYQWSPDGTRLAVYGDGREAEAVTIIEMATIDSSEFVIAPTEPTTCG